MSRNGRYLFTSESVTEGHPDKIADQISDSILDAILAQDPVGRVACETLVTTGLAIVAGEITTSCYVDFPKIVRETIREVGYTRGEVRLRLRDLRRPLVDPRPVARHRAGRRSRRRRRPGPDVRLRLHRDARADADADHARAQARRAACPSARRDGVARLPPPRRQVAGLDRVRQRQARSASTPSSSPPSTARRSATRRSAKTSPRRSSIEVIPTEMMDAKTRDPHQPDRPLRRRRPARRRRRDRPQDHRRHLRRRGAARRRRVLRARTRRRSIARRATWRATSRRTSSRPASRSAAWCSSPTRSASPSRSRC